MLALVFAVSNAAAQTDSAAAEALFARGKELMKAGNYGEACPKLAESQRLDPAAGTQIVLGDCFAAQGKTASAWALWNEVLSAATTKKRADIEGQMKEKIAAIEPKLSRLTIVVPAQVASLSGIEVKRDGVIIGPASWGMGSPMDPGPHAIEAIATGKQRWSAIVDVRGAMSSVSVPILVDEPKAVVAPPPPPASTTPAKPSPETSGPTAERSQPSTVSTQKALGIVVSGLGVVGIVAGAVFYTGWKSKDDDVNTYAAGAGATCIQPCTAEYQHLKSLRDDATSAKMPIYLSFGIGGALAVGGVALLLTAPSSKSAFRFAPTVGPSSGGLAAGGTFLASVSEDTFFDAHIGTRDPHANDNSINRGTDDGARGGGVLVERPDPSWRE